MPMFAVDESYFAGAASIERVDGALRPWRLPHQSHGLFPSPGNALVDRAQCTSGVRLRFVTDASRLTLRFAPLGPTHGSVPEGHAFDLVRDNAILQVARCKGGATQAAFADLPAGKNLYEIWLPPSCGVDVQGLELPAGATLYPVPDRRPMWVTWGSSLTHCVRAGSAARVWPGTVARTHDLNLVNLGFGGQCHLDPMIAMHIRDLPASFISLKLGINMIGGGSVNARTYPALIVGAVQIIREKHPHTPLLLVSPYACPPRESTPNAVGYTLEGMRRDMQDVHRRCVEGGDRNLYYVSGYTLFTAEDIEEHAPDDKCHAGAAGIDLQAERFIKHAMPLLLGQPRDTRLSYR